MTSFETAKRSFAAHKGYFNRSLKLFYSLLDVKPSPLLSSVEKSYKQLQNRMDLLFTLADETISSLEGGAYPDVDVAKEIETLNEYYDTLISEQTKIETDFVLFKEKHEISQPVVSPSVQSPTFTKPLVKLTALKPPSWSGVKADFYTWKRKFIHIMQEAQISDDLTQLCYLQNAQTLPNEYQSYISDCSSIEKYGDDLNTK